MCDDALTEGAGCDACQKAGSRLNAKLNGVSGHWGNFSARKSPATVLVHHFRDMRRRRSVRPADPAEPAAHPCLRN